MKQDTAARALIQKLKSLQTAGVTHLPALPEVARIDLPVSGPSQAVNPVAGQAPPPHQAPQPGPPMQSHSRPQAASQQSQQSPPHTPRPQPPRRPQKSQQPQSAPKIVMPKFEPTDDPKQQQLNLLAAECAQCMDCDELVRNRTQTVFGVGNPDARLVFVGEAPGADEDKQGIPFVGRAGKLLTDIIEKGMGIARDEIYICNILRCRPPGNRNPFPIEAARCRRFLDATLDVIQPEFICCLGAVAAQNLLDTTETIGRMRGRILDYRGIKVVCTYHPAYLLRSPNQKTKTWEDIQLLMREMGMPVKK